MTQSYRLLFIVYENKLAFSPYICCVLAVVSKKIREGGQLPYACAYPTKTATLKMQRTTGSQNSSLLKYSSYRMVSRYGACASYDISPFISIVYLIYRRTSYEYVQYDFTSVLHSIHRFLNCKVFHVVRKLNIVYKSIFIEIV